MFEINFLQGMVFDKPADAGASGGGEPDGKSGGTPQEQFRNLVGELKDLVGRTDTEAKSAIDKLNERLDDFEMDWESHKKNIMARSPGQKNDENERLFKDAFYRFVKGDREALARDVESGKVEVKEGYHHSFRGTKSGNIVRFDEATGGALLMPEEIASEMIRNVIESTPVTSIVRLGSTSRATRKRRLRVGTPGGRWLEEEGKNEKVKPQYRTVTWTPKKWASRYALTIEQEQDQGVDVISELRMAYGEDYEKDVGSAVVQGDGVGKPKGFIHEIGTHPSTGNVLSTDDLIHMQESLKESYQQNGSWLFNRRTRGVIRALVLSQDNALQYTWEPDFQRKSPTRLLGDPIYIASVDDLASPDDVAAKSFTTGHEPIVYGDFNRGYELVNHTDIYIIDDPYSESETFVRNLHIMSRVDGQVLQTEALVKLVISATQG